MSVEALAMAGADYTEYEFYLEVSDRSPRLQRPRPLSYPVAKQRLTINVDRLKRNSSCSTSTWAGPVVDGDPIKAKIREWAKAVVLSTIYI